MPRIASTALCASATSSSNVRAAPSCASIAMAVSNCFAAFGSARVIDLVRLLGCRDDLVDGGLLDLLGTLHIGFVQGPLGRQTFKGLGHLALDAAVLLGSITPSIKSLSALALIVSCSVRWAFRSAGSAVL